MAYRKRSVFTAHRRAKNMAIHARWQRNYRRTRDYSKPGAKMATVNYKRAHKWVGYAGKMYGWGKAAYPYLKYVKY